MKRVIAAFAVVAVPIIVWFRESRSLPTYPTWAEYERATRRVRCDECGDWACDYHGGHIGERCDCWPCDDCGDLSDELDDGLCKECQPIQRDPYVEALAR